jgi:hypothetical protein
MKNAILTVLLTVASTALYGQSTVAGVQKDAVVICKDTTIINPKRPQNYLVCKGAKLDFYDTLGKIGLAWDTIFNLGEVHIHEGSTNIWNADSAILTVDDSSNNFCLISQKSTFYVNDSSQHGINVQTELKFTYNGWPGKQNPCLNCGKTMGNKNARTVIPQLNIFPNPASDIIHYSGPEPLSLTILTKDNRIVLEDHSHPLTEIKITTLPVGMYWVQLRFGHSVVSLPLIKL